MIKQIGLDPERGRPILLITRMSTELDSLQSCYHHLLFIIIIIIVVAVVDIDININIKNEITAEVRSCNYL